MSLPFHHPQKKKSSISNRSLLYTMVKNNHNTIIITISRVFSQCSGFPFRTRLGTVDGTMVPTSELPPSPALVYAPPARTPSPACRGPGLLALAKPPLPLYLTSPSSTPCRPSSPSVREQGRLRFLFFGLLSWWAHSYFLFSPRRSVIVCFDDKGSLRKSSKYPSECYCWWLLCVCFF